MKIVPKDDVTCPTCGMVMTLSKEPVNLVIHGRVIGIEQWQYGCKNCGEKYTTTESDTLSMKKISDILDLFSERVPKKPDK